MRPDGQVRDRDGSLVDVDQGDLVCCGPGGWAPGSTDDAPRPCPHHRPRAAGTVRRLRTTEAPARQPPQWWHDLRSDRTPS